MSNLLKVRGFVDELKRNEISRSCLSECERNQCCTDLEHFSLEIGPEQIALLYGDRLRAEHPGMARTRNGQERLLRMKINQLITNGILFPENGSFKYTGPVCPKYDPSGKACEVHDSYFRPQCCAKFPIFAEEDFLQMDARCGYIGRNWEGIFQEVQGYGLANSKEGAFSIRVICNGVPGRPVNIYSLPEDIDIVREMLSFKGLK